ncbi:MAG: hypothetical protein LBQ81_06480 [Zoogloeaceae bacterium]|nr:hypothetical protein [Zoogloeaceae bacterium]
MPRVLNEDRKQLLTGGADFIGANFVPGWLTASDDLVINLDKLTGDVPAPRHCAFATESHVEFRELAQEVPEAELEQVRQHLPRLMRGVGQLKAPLVVDVGVGANWDATH